MGLTMLGGAEAEPIKVYYWQGFQGRGWAPRLYIRALGMQFEEGFLGADEVKGKMKEAGFCAMGGKGKAFAPPAISVNGTMFCQVAGCLNHLSKLGKAEPANPVLASKSVEVAMTAA